VPAAGTAGTGGTAQIVCGGAMPASAEAAPAWPASDPLGTPEFPADPSIATGRGYFGLVPPCAPVLPVTWSILPPEPGVPEVVGLPPLAPSIGASAESTTRALHAVMSITTIANDPSRRKELRLELCTSFF